MRIPKDHRSIVNDIIDEALDSADGDINRAAYYVASELEDLEGGGQQWANDVAHGAMVDGLKQMVRSRLRSKRVTVQSTTMPAFYTVGVTSAEWVKVHVDDLDPVIERLSARARSYTEHAAVLIDAQKWAKEHEVDTPAEAFAAEGITVTEVA